MGCLAFFFCFFVFILCPYLKSFPALYPRLQQILEFRTWQANQSFFFLGVDQWDWRTGPLVSWPSPPSGPRPVVGFRGQEQEPETARVAKDRFGREKENNRYGHSAISWNKMTCHWNCFEFACVSPSQSTMSCLKVTNLHLVSVRRTCVEGIQMDVWIRDKYLFTETFLGHIVSVKTHLSSRF